MSQAEELLNSLSGETAYTTLNHVTIGSDRKLAVPYELKKLGVSSDHGVNTIHFVGPRYSENGTDLSKMDIWVNFMRIDGYPDQSHCENVTVDPEDDTLLHYDWVITRNVTEVSGELVMVVCVKSVDKAGFEQSHWNSEPCSDFYIVEGLEVQESVISQYPDLVEYMLFRVAAVENKTTKAAMLSYVNQYLNEDPSVIIENIEKVIAGYPIEQFVKDYLDDYVDICTTENRILNGCYSGAYEMVSMEGVSEQATTEGYQLFDISTAVSEAKVTVTDVNTSSISITFEDYYYGSIYTTQRDLLDTIVSSVGKTIHLTCDAEYDSEMYSSIILNGTFSDGTTYYEKASIPGTTYCKLDIPDTLISLANVSLRFARKKSAYSLTDFKINNIMLYFDGDGTHEMYTGGIPSPSPEYPQEIKSVGPEVTVKTVNKNLLKNIAKTSTSNGITFTVNDDGSVTVNGTATAGAWLNVTGTLSLPAGTYILSGCPTGGSYGSTYVLSSTLVADYGNPKSFTLDETTNITVNIGVYSGCTVDNLTFYPMISVEGGEYIPHQESSATITLTDELRGINDISDVIEKRDSVWGVNRKRVKRVFDGVTESWGEGTTSSDKHYIYLGDPSIYINENALLTHGTRDLSGTWETGNFTQSGGLSFQIWTDMTLDEWKTYLAAEYAAGTPVMLECDLVAPAWEELDSDAQKVLDNLEVYDDVTHVIVESDIQPVVTSKYGTSHTGATIITQANEIEKLKEQIADIVTVLDSLKDA